jgi:hypothetical protein
MWVTLTHQVYTEYPLYTGKLFAAIVARLLLAI